MSHSSPAVKLNAWRYALILLVTVLCGLGLLRMIELVSADEARLKLAQGVEYFSGGSKLTAEQLATDTTEPWLTEQNDLLSFGMSDAVYWLRTDIPALSAQYQWLLDLDYGLIDHVEVFVFQHGSQVEHFVSGDALPFTQRPVLHEKFLFPLPGNDQPFRILLKIQTNGAVKLPLYVWRTDKFAVFNGEHNIVMGLFFGFMAAMALSNFFFFITSRSASFLVYSGYAIGLALTLASLHGLGYKYLWPNNIWLENHSIGIFVNVTLMCAMLFSYYLLDVGKHSRRAESILRKLAAFFAVMVLAATVVPYNLFIRITLVCLLFTVIYVYALAIWLSIRGERIARLYTLAWTTLLVSGFIASLENLNIVDVNFNSQYLLMLGGSIETLLLALVLALSYTEQREDKLRAQQNALLKEIQLREANDNLLALQEEAQRELEYKVQERTLELQITLRELEEANHELEENSSRDGLTGVRNRRHFDKRYIAEVRRSRREQTPLTVAMLDIDHFKQVNDTYGHLVGDDCIRHVAALVKSALKRPMDEVCRYGGEEFAIILPNTDAEGAWQLLEQLRQQVATQPVTTSAGNICMTASIGFCSQVVALGFSDNQILQAADSALYQAKRDGRNRTHSHSGEPNLAQDLS